MLLLKLLFTAFLSFIFTFYLVPILSKFAVQYNFVDVPDGKVKLHKKITPYFGGLAVYVGFIIAIGLMLPFEHNLFLFVISTLILLFLGLIDDLFVLKPYQKFFGQCIATLCFLKAGFYLKEQHFYSVWNIALSGLWILTVINAFNLVDVMDGLATTIALCAATTFFVYAVLVTNIPAMILLMALMGSLLAFLCHNFPPARIYLGDAGSLFIGGFLATIPFLFHWSTYNTHGSLAPVIILGIPLLEMAGLIIIRTYKGIPFYRGSPDHFSFYLRNKGWSVPQILGYVTLLSAVTGSTGLLFYYHKLSLFHIVILGSLFITQWILVIFYQW